MRRDLTHNPLVEAVFELWWDFSGLMNGDRSTSEYEMFERKVCQEFEREYEERETLIACNVLDEPRARTPRYRFRKGRSKWPFVQMGRGIITVNAGNEYRWDDFEGRITQAVNILYKSCPDSNKLTINGARLYYIDAIPLDLVNDELLEFLSKKLKVSVDLHESLFQDTGVNRLDSNIELKLSFGCSLPRGIIHLRFVTVIRERTDTLTWETVVESGPGDAPESRTEIFDWVRAAHDLTDDWFFKLIDGDLLRWFE